MTFAGREAPDVEALRTDRYLDSLLAAAERRASDVPAGAALDPVVRLAATRLARDLVRVHPSFRFEDRLAARLSETARAMRGRAAAGGGQLVVPLPVAAPAPAGQLDHLETLDPRHGHPFLVGGALTSAAISIAGAAWVAWRWSRPAPRSPMARAVRAARQARLVRELS